MQPTVEAELAGIRRSLAALAADHALPVDVTEELAAVIRTLQRLETSWSRVLPYLLSDNAATAELLRELAPLLPGELRAEIDAAVSAQSPPPEPGALDVGAANERNQALRDLLSRAILACAAGDAETRTRVRARVAAGLRQSLDNRPW
jgi:hypothetical protein